VLDVVSPLHERSLSNPDCFLESYLLSLFSHDQGETP
jgi:hypothetical protein